jgi:hypothetical protein
MHHLVWQPSAPYVERFVPRAHCACGDEENSKAHLYYQRDLKGNKCISSSNQCQTKSLFPSHHRKDFSLHETGHTTRPNDSCIRNINIKSQSTRLQCGWDVLFSGTSKDERQSGAKITKMISPGCAPSETSAMCPRIVLQHRRQ